MSLDQSRSGPPNSKHPCVALCTVCCRLTFCFLWQTYFESKLRWRADYKTLPMIVDNLSLDTQRLDPAGYIKDVDLETENFHTHNTIVARIATHVDILPEHLTIDNTALPFYEFRDEVVRCYFYNLYVNKGCKMLLFSEESSFVTEFKQQVKELKQDTNAYQRLQLVSTELNKSFAEHAKIKESGATTKKDFYDGIVEITEFIKRYTRLDNRHRFSVLTMMIAADFDLPPNIDHNISSVTAARELANPESLWSFCKKHILDMVKAIDYPEYGPLLDDQPYKKIGW